MAHYNPDLWSVIHVTTPTGEQAYRVFACWYGGFAGSDSWKISSAVEKITKDDRSIMFHNASGSTYSAYRNNYGMSGYGSNVFHSLLQDAEQQGGKMKIRLLSQQEALGLEV